MNYLYVKIHNETGLMYLGKTIIAVKLFLSYNMKMGMEVIEEAKMKEIKNFVSTQPDGGYNYYIRFSASSH